MSVSPKFPTKKHGEISPFFAVLGFYRNVLRLKLLISLSPFSSDRSGIDNVNFEKKKLNVDKKKMVKPEPEDHRPWETEQYSGIRIM